MRNTKTPKLSWMARLMGVLVLTLAVSLAGVGDGDAKAKKRKTKPKKPAAAVVRTVPAPVVAGTSPIWAHVGSDLAPDDAVVYGTLPNGMRYAIMKNKTPSKQVSLRLRFGMGALSETDDQEGFAHLLEHMAFNGSKNVAEGEMIKILERWGLAFGPDTNAYTSFDETVYQLDLPQNSEELLDTGMFLLRETAENLLLDQKAIDDEKGIVLSEERVRNTPGYRLFKAQYGFLLPKARLMNRMPIGKVEDIKAAQSGSLRSLYANYRPTNAFLVAVGDIDPKALEAILVKRFADWKEPEAPKSATPAAGPIEALPTGFKVFTDPDVTTVLTIALVKPWVFEPDTRANRRAAFLRELGLAALNRRLRTLARSADAKILGGGASFEDLETAAKIASISVYSEPANWKDSLNVAEQELRRALQYGFSAAEIDEQLSEYLTAARVAAQSAATRETPALANEIARSFHEKVVFTTPAQDLALLEADAKTASVKAVNEAFAKIWAGAQPQVFLATPKALAGGDGELKAAFDASKATPVARPTANATLVFGYDNFGPEGKIVAQSRIEDIDTLSVRFDNEVRANIKQTKFKDKQVNVRVRVCCGRADLAGAKPGLTAFVSFAMQAWGLQKHSADELERIFAGTTVGYRFDMQDDAYAFTATVEPKDLEATLKLIAATMTASGYRAEAKAVWDKQIRVYDQNFDATPQGVLGRKLSAFVRNDDPRWSTMPLDAMLALTLDDARAALTKPFTEGPIEVAVVGDMPSEQVLPLLAKTFGALPDRAAVWAPPAAGLKLALPAKPRAAIEYHEGPANRAAKVVIWAAPDFLSDPVKARRVNLLNRVFENRLIDVLREKMAATYSPDASTDLSDTFPGFGYVITSIDLEPERIAGFDEALNLIVKDLAAGNFTQDEVDRARRPLLEGVAKDLENNGYWLNSIDNLQFTPDSLNWHRTRAKNYADISIKDLKWAARTVFADPPRVVMTVVSKTAPAVTAAVPVTTPPADAKAGSDSKKPKPPSALIGQ